MLEKEFGELRSAVILGDVLKVREALLPFMAQDVPEELLQAALRYSVKTAKPLVVAKALSVITSYSWGRDRLAPTVAPDGWIEHMCLSKVIGRSARGYKEEQTCLSLDLCQRNKNILNVAFVKSQDVERQLERAVWPIRVSSINGFLPDRNVSLGYYEVMVKADKALHKLYNWAEGRSENKPNLSGLVLQINAELTKLAFDDILRSWRSPAYLLSQDIKMFSDALALLQRDVQKLRFSEIGKRGITTVTSGNTFRVHEYEVSKQIVLNLYDNLLKDKYA